MNIGETQRPTSSKVRIIGGLRVYTVGWVPQKHISSPNG